MRRKITEFYTLKSSHSTVAGGVGFWRDFLFGLVVVTFFAVDTHKSAGRTIYSKMPPHPVRCQPLLLTVELWV